MNSTVSEYFYFYINCCLVLQQTRHNHHPAYIKSATVVDADWLFLCLIGFLFHHWLEILLLLLQFFLQPRAVPPDYLQAAVSAWFSLLLIVLLTWLFFQVLSSLKILTCNCYCYCLISILNYKILLPSLKYVVLDLLLYSLHTSTSHEHDAWKEWKNIHKVFERFSTLQFFSINLQQMIVFVQLY